MKDYADCIAYLHDLGFPMEMCERVCESYEEKHDMEGLVDYVFLCEMMVDSCVD